MNKQIQAEKHIYEWMFISHLFMPYSIQKKFEAPEVVFMYVV